MPTKPFALVVKAAILDVGGRCLLIRRSAHNRAFVGDWEWPGGKVDPGEGFATGLCREVAEETGLTIELTGLIGATAYEAPATRFILLCMEARLVGGEVKLSEEHDAAAWVALTELDRYKLGGQVRALMLEYAQRRTADSSPPRAGERKP